MCTDVLTITSLKVMMTVGQLEQRPDIPVLRSSFTHSLGVSFISLTRSTHCHIVSLICILQNNIFISVTISILSLIFYVR